MIRRGNSDSRLTRLLKPDLEDESLNNFLPKFLLRDINPNEEARLKQDLDEKNCITNFFDSEEDMPHFDILKNLDTFSKVLKTIKTLGT